MASIPDNGETPWGDELRTWLLTVGRTAGGPKNVREVVNAVDAGCVGDNSTDNRAALQSAINTANGQKTVYLEPGTYYVDVGTTELSVPDTATPTIIEGAGPGTVIRLGPNATTDNDISLMRLTGTRKVIFRNLTIQAMTRGSGGVPSAIQHVGTDGYIRAENVHFKDFAFALRTSPGTSSTASIEALLCTFEGDGTNPSSGCLATSFSTGNRGKHLYFDYCRFINIGQSASQLTHGIYTYTDFDLRVNHCTFESSIGTGWGVHIYDTTTSAANASRNQQVMNCWFSSALTCGGVVTGPNGHATIRNCIFESPGTCVRIYSGRVVDIHDCIFESVAGGNLIDCGSGNGARVRIRGCNFMGVYTKAIVCDNTNYWEITSCKFQPSTNSSYDISLEGGTPYVYVHDCYFSGGANTAHIRATVGNTLEISRCCFTTTAGTVIANQSGSTLSILRVMDNDFSQSSGQTISLAATPGTMERRGNYGSVGYGPKYLFGTGTPESVITAPVGSLYQRDDGGAGTSLYVKQSGTGNTGWVGK
jgi:hypothetical protein